MASRYVVPREPVNEGDVFLPLRETNSLLRTIVGETGKVPLVDERERDPDAVPTALEAKVDDLVSCLNKLTRAVSGR